jgi:putative hemolysin
MMSYELSYAKPDDPLFRRLFMRAIEDLSGRSRLLPLYRRWRQESVHRRSTMWSDALDMIDTKLEITGPEDWHCNVSERPLVIIANHPFGIADGLAVLALAERLGRPYRILLNADLMRVPEIEEFGLPIDFSGTRDALATNLKTRAEARRLLSEGATIVIFPGGGVATAERLFGKAEELPWKQFAVRLIQPSGATVLPVYFEGQNSALFHLVSRYSLTLRLSLLVCEFRYKVGSIIKARIGSPVPYADLIANSHGRQPIDELYVLVQQLAPGSEDLEASELLPRSLNERRRFPWDPPLVEQTPIAAPPKDVPDHRGGSVCLNNWGCR